MLWDAGIKWSWCLDRVLQPDLRSGWINTRLHLSVSVIPCYQGLITEWQTQPPHGVMCGSEIYSRRSKTDEKGKRKNGDVATWDI